MWFTLRRIYRNGKSLHENVLKFFKNLGKSLCLFVFSDKE